MKAAANLERIKPGLSPRQVAQVMGKFGLVVIPKKSGGHCIVATKKRVPLLAVNGMRLEFPMRGSRTGPTIGVAMSLRRAVAAHLEKVH
ncbi:hypothetical protein COU36_02965 [Candidatus Micrarchaeota archaeon CG10_big_fil_rev_8_21_14_0_10_59_7]|nr:MAG: hypothetical protein COU36_02965 [Candidatus Micrarchaeota archaeon CG10_big_fil_rev_8_21_14_0_10_59_7]